MQTVTVTLTLTQDIEIVIPDDIWAQDTDNILRWAIDGAISHVSPHAEISDVYASFTLDGELVEYADGR
jgi:hypothetical protein